MINFIDVILNFITSLVDFEFFLWFVAVFSLFAIIQLFRKLVFD